MYRCCTAVCCALSLYTPASRCCWSEWDCPKESHCCCCFAVSFVQLLVQGEVAGDGASEVDEVLCHLKGGVGNGDAADSLTLNRHLISITSSWSS